MWKIGTLYKSDTVVPKVDDGLSQCLCQLQVCIAADNEEVKCELEQSSYIASLTLAWVNSFLPDGHIHEVAANRGLNNGSTIRLP